MIMCNMITCGRNDYRSRKSESDIAKTDHPVKLIQRIYFQKTKSEIARCGQEVLATSHFGCMEISILKNWLLLFFGLD